MTWTVAEFGVAITLALLRDIPAAIDAVRAGGWPDSARTGRPYVFRDLADCRVGLAGYGSINRHYRRFVEPYGCAVTVFDPFVGHEVAAADSFTRADSLVDLASGTVTALASVERRTPRSLASYPCGCHGIPVEGMSGAPAGRPSTQAKSSLTTCPSTSVKRKSRPA